MKAQPEQNRDPKEDDERSMQMAGTTTWGNHGFNTTKTRPHYGMMALGLAAGRGAKACQGPAACPAPSTLGDAGAKIFGSGKRLQAPFKSGGPAVGSSPPT